MSAPDNPLAFPSPDTKGSYYQSGMTLRDWFAGQALAGLSANTEWLRTAYRKTGKTTETTAASAYEFADAMLAERAKVQP